MNASIIPVYLEHRMKEMGHCNGYVMRIKHFILDPGQTRQISAYGEVYIVLEPVPDVKIESDLGIFSNTAKIPEQQHEHSGQLFLTNLSMNGKCSVQFVQAIPIETNPDACAPCQTNERS